MGWPGKSPVLAQRAVSEDPRWTRAVGDSSGPSQDNINELAWTSHLGSLAAALLISLFEHPARVFSCVLARLALAKIVSAHLRIIFPNAYCLSAW